MPSRVILISNFKGGAGKTLLSYHLAHAASERRVLTIDTDVQGDLYKRFPGARLDSRATGAVTQWRENSWIQWSPLRWVEPLTPFDLVLVDSGAKDKVLPGPRPPDILLIPINGQDAAANSNEIAADALAQGTRQVILVYNGYDLGAAAKKRMAGFGANLPPGVRILPTTIENNRALMEDTIAKQRPAWEFGRGKAGTTLLRACSEILQLAG